MKFDEFNLYRDQGYYKKVLELISSINIEKDTDKINYKLLYNDALIGLHNYEKALSIIQKLIVPQKIYNKKNQILLDLQAIECKIKLHYSKEDIIQHINRLESKIKLLQNSTIPLEDEIIKFLVIKASFEKEIGNFKKADHFLKKAYKESRISKYNKINQSKIALLLAQLYYEREDYDTALEYTMKGLAISTGQHLKLDIAKGYELLGLLALENNLDQSLKYFILSLKIDEELENKLQYANILHHIGTVYTLKNELEKALEYFQQSFTQYDALANQSQSTSESFENELISVFKSIGDIFVKKNQYYDAIEYFSKAEGLVFKSNTRQKSSILYSIGNAYFKLGDNKEALSYYKEALKLLKKIPHTKISKVAVLWGMGNIYFISGQYKNAISYYNQLKEIYREKNRFNYVSEVLLIEIALYSEKKSTQDVEKCFNQLQKLYQANSSPHIRQSFVLAKAECYKLKPGLEKFLALELYKKVLYETPMNPFYKHYTLLNVIATYCNELELGTETESQINPILNDLIQYSEQMEHFSIESSNYTLYLNSLLLSLIFKSLLDHTTPNILSMLDFVDKSNDFIEIKDVSNDIRTNVSQIREILDNKIENQEYRKKIVKKAIIPKLIKKMLKKKYWLR